MKAIACRFSIPAMHLLDRRKISFKTLSYSARRLWKKWIFVGDGE
jgi:hypothetical protein